ncbi:hypothetical protein LTS10_012012 [Elasticomyces elasticus]|nr:hypothetical protein LTS10_012012 [Elasticomyces elasticus]
MARKTVERPEETTTSFTYVPAADEDSSVGDLINEVMRSWQDTDDESDTTESDHGTTLGETDGAVSECMRVCKASWGHSSPVWPPSELRVFLAKIGKTRMEDWPPQVVNGFVDLARLTGRDLLGAQAAIRQAMDRDQGLEKLGLFVLPGILAAACSLIKNMRLLDENDHSPEPLLRGKGKERMVEAEVAQAALSHMLPTLQESRTQLAENRISDATSVSVVVPRAEGSRGRGVHQTIGVDAEHESDRSRTLSPGSSAASERMAKVPGELRSPRPSGRVRSVSTHAPSTLNTTRSPQIFADASAHSVSRTRPLSSHSDDSASDYDALLYPTPGYRRAVGVSDEDNITDSDTLFIASWSVGSAAP